MAGSQALLVPADADRFQDAIGAQRVTDQVWHGSPRSSTRPSAGRRSASPPQPGSSCLTMDRQLLPLPDRLNESLDVAQAEGTSPMAVGSVQ